MQDNQQRSRLGGCLKIFFIIIIILVVLSVVLGMIGSVYQRQAQQAFLDDNPPPGILVDVGGRNLHIHCMGEGSPTIILDAGQGGWSIDYTELQTQLATNTQVCAYDRAGYGWSDPTDDSRTVQDIAEDLDVLLSGAEIDAPYILVAFSFAGLPARYYAEQYPEDLAGLVLIDPAHEVDRDTMPPDLLSAQQSLLGTYQVFEGAATIGLVRFLEPAEIAPYAPFIASNPVSPELYYEGVANSSWWATSRKEFATNLFGELPDLATNFDLRVRIVGLTNSIPDASYDDINQSRLAVFQAMADNSESTELIVFDDIAHEEIIRETDLLADVIVSVYMPDN